MMMMTMMVMVKVKVKVKVKDNDVDERHMETQTDWMHARSTRAQGIQWECGIAMDRTDFFKCWDHDKPWLFLRVPDFYTHSLPWIYGFYGTVCCGRSLFCAGQPGEMRRERVMAGRLSEKKATCKEPPSPTWAKGER